jgi:phosphatidylglycerophosphate synthase
MIPKQQKDFLIVIGSYIVAVIAIALMLPIGRKWFFVVLVLFILGCVLDWYWNEHFKK